MPRKIGTVKFFKTDKGYGFIKPDGDEGDVFVHITDIEASGMKGIAVDDRVSFEIGQGRKGEKAINLKAER